MGPLSGVYVCYTNRSFLKLKLLLWCIWFRGKKLFGIIGLSVRGYRLEKSSPGSLFPSDVILTISRDCLSNSTVPFCLCWLSPRKQKKLTRHLDFDRLNFFVTSYISWWFFFYCSSLCGNVFFYPLLPVAQMTIKNVCWW